MHVILVMAITLDGKIGKDPNHFPDWTEKADKRLFSEISRKAGVVIMGSRTFETLGAPLPGRKNVVLTRDTTHKSPWDNLEYTDRRPKEVLDALERDEYSEVVLAGGSLVNSLFAAENLIDDIIVTVSPKIFGQGLSLFTEDISMELELKDVTRMGHHLVCITYRVIK